MTFERVCLHTFFIQKAGERANRRISSFCLNSLIVHILLTFFRSEIVYLMDLILKSVTVPSDLEDKVLAAMAERRAKK